MIVDGVCGCRYCFVVLPFFSDLGLFNGVGIICFFAYVVLSCLLLLACGLVTVIVAWVLVA